MKAFNDYLIKQDKINTWGGILSMCGLGVSVVLILAKAVPTIPWWVLLGVPAILAGTFFYRELDLDESGPSKWFKFYKTYNCDSKIDEAKLGLNIDNNEQVIMIKVKNTWWYVGERHTIFWAYNGFDNKENNKVIVNAINKVAQYNNKQQNVVPYSDDLETELGKLEGGKE